MPNTVNQPMPRRDPYQQRFLLNSQDQYCEPARPPVKKKPTVVNLVKQAAREVGAELHLWLTSPGSY